MFNFDQVQTGPLYNQISDPIIAEFLEEHLKKKGYFRKNLITIMIEQKSINKKVK